jgi:hypothetical protein
MSEIVVGRNALIKIGGTSATTITAEPIVGLQSWSVDAPDTIDVTVAGSGHKRMIVGLQPGMITAEVIEDIDDDALALRLSESLAGNASNVFFSSDAGATWDYMWRALVTANYNTGGPNDVAKRTITFYRQENVTDGGSALGEVDNGMPFGNHDETPA